MNDHPVLQVRMIRRLLCAKTYKRLLSSVGCTGDGRVYAVIKCPLGDSEAPRASGFWVSGFDGPVS